MPSPSIVSRYCGNTFSRSRNARAEGTRRPRRPGRRRSAAASLTLPDLRWFEELPHGGHFAALEQPQSLVKQVRGFFRLFR
ncbi:hypothetical protein [Streptomyces tendae]|uniref:hypothetical protein n=1 Tax=Streptomyces tendae TaxID=1932 RepID=UPI003F4CE9DC